MRRPRAGGGWAAIWYTLKMSRRAGGVLRMYRALRTRNACKTCALGMGGQRGGMVNEAGRFPEVCKKSVQAMAADAQGELREEFFEKFDFDHLRRMTPRQLEWSGRITTPLYAGPGDRTYRAIPWDEALDRVSTRLRDTAPDRSFFYFSGRSSNEAGFLLQLVARLYGTNNVNNCSFFCHQASGVGLASVTGSGTASVVLEDVDRCDLIFLIGGNPASNHPRLMRSLMDLRRRGGSVVVVNPLRELGLERFKVPSDVRSLFMGSRIANMYLQPHIGGDIALLTGIAKALLETGQIDDRFVTECSDGWDAWRERIEHSTWDEIESRSGVSHAEIERAAAMYGHSDRTIFCWTMGITHHLHGVENVQTIANLAMMRGMLGKPGAGLLPLRGHSNVQGIGSMGVTPALKAEMLRVLEKDYGLELPTEPGLDTLSCIERAGEGDIEIALSLGGNLYGSCPDASSAERALSRVGMTVFLSTTLNTGHVRGRGEESIILPVRARDEESQSTTQESMFNFVRLSDGGRARHEGPRHEVEVIASLARRVLGEGCPLDFEALESHREIRRMIAKVIPGYGAIGAIDDHKREFHIEGRTFHEPRFATPSGKAKFHAVAMPADSASNDSLRLMTIRSEGQFNTVVYEEEDLYRGQERRDVILMNQEDIDRLGLKVDERVTVRSTIGEMPGILVRAVDIRAGNAAMYYPEANVLVPGAADPASRTPTFKNTPIEIVKSSPLAVLSTG